ncbi:unnamed protein product [Phyllotreta striolata]|uniref:Uncharacterized protein n=1 Tax=Phyllotreta striolata TaxID=444603 RepID=A0A9N9TLQ6_PHYSR|nr:unnamed protein product [Phyllotreta striolata]
MLIILFVLVLHICTSSNSYTDDEDLELENILNAVVADSWENNENLYVVNIKEKINYPAVYVNSSDNISVFDYMQPTMYLIAGNLQDILKKLSDLSILNRRGKFVFILPNNRFAEESKGIINKYYLNKLILIIKNNQKYRLFLLNNLNTPLNTSNIFTQIPPKKVEKLNVLSAIYPPYVIRTDEGIFIDIILMAASNLKISINFTLSRFAANTFNVSPEFVPEYFDLYASPISKYSFDVENTICLTEDRAAWAAPILVRTKYWSIFYEEYQLMVWLAFFGLLPVLYVFMKIIVKLIPNQTDIAIMPAICNLVLENSSHLVFDSVSLKIIFSSYMVFCIVFTNVYKSKMFDIMTGGLSTQMIQNADDLIKYKFLMGFPAQAYVDLYKYGNTSFGQALVRNQQMLVCGHYTACLNRTAFKKDMITARLERLFKYIMPRDYVDENGKSLLYMMKHNKKVTLNFGLVFQKGHPLYKRFNKNLMRLFEGGFVQQFCKQFDRQYEQAMSLAEIEKSDNKLSLEMLLSTISPEFVPEYFDLYASPISEYLPDVENSISLAEDRAAWVAPILVRTKYWSIFYEEYQFLVWLAFFGILPVLYVFMKIIVKLIPYQTDIAIMPAICNLVLENSSHLVFDSVSLKIIFSSYMVFCIVFTNVYKSFPAPVYVDMYKNTNTSFHQALTRNQQMLVCGHYTACLNRTAFKKDMITIRLQRLVKYIIPREYVDEKRKSLLYIIIKERPKILNFGLVFQKDHPFYRRFNLNLMRLLEGGFVQQSCKQFDRQYEQAMSLAEMKKSNNKLSLEMLLSTKNSSIVKGDEDLELKNILNSVVADSWQKNENVYVVNVKEQIYYPSVNVNSSVDVTIFDYTQPTMYLIAGNLQDILKKLSDLSILNRRGKYVLILPNNRINEDIKGLTTKYYLNKILLIIKNYQRYELFLHDDLANPLQNISNIFAQIPPKKFTKLNVLGALYPPYVIRNGEGIFIDIISMAASTLNVSINFTLSRYAANTFRISPEFVPEYFDLYASPISEYFPDVENSISLAEDRAAWVAPILVRTKYWSIFYEEYQFLVWLAFFGLLPVLYLFMKIIVKLIPNQTDIAIMPAICNLVLENSSHLVFDSVSLKIIFSSYMVFCIVFTNVYKSKMFDIMTGGLDTQLIQNYDDIIKNKFLVGFPAPVYVDIYKNTNTSFHQALTRNQQLLVCGHYTACLNRTAFKKDMITVRLERLVKYIIPKEYVDEKRKSLLYIIIKERAKIILNFGLVFQKDHPFYRRFNLNLMRLLEGGFVQQSCKQFDRQYDQAMSLAEMKKSNNKLSLEMLLSTFVVYLFMMLLSTIVFFIELYWR